MTEASPAHSGRPDRPEEQRPPERRGRRGEPPDIPCVGWRVRSQDDGLVAGRLRDGRRGLAGDRDDRGGPPSTIDRQSGSGIFWNAGSPNPTYVITATGGETSLSYTTSESATPVEVPANGVVALSSAAGFPIAHRGFPRGLQTSRSGSTSADTTPPSVSVALVGTAARPAGTGRLSRSSRLAPATCCRSPAATLQWTTDYAANAAPVSVTDAAGNVGTGSVSPPFNYDNTPPDTSLASGGGLPQASRNHRRQRAPFRWTRGGPDLRPRSLRGSSGARRRHRRGCGEVTLGRRHWSR